MTARTNWFNGQRVFQDALTHSQDSLITADKNRIVDFFTVPGIVNGLTLSSSGGYATVGTGVGYDGNGDRVRVSTYQSAVGYNGLCINAATGSYDIVAQYTETNDGIYGINPSGVGVYEHILDSFTVAAKKVGTDTVSAVTDIVLGRAVVASTYGAISLSSLNRQVTSVRSFGP